jgi:hypothetical protein
VGDFFTNDVKGDNMKFTKKSLHALIFIGIPLTVSAADYSNDSYDRYGDQKYQYRGSSGAQYQYDLSKPSDQLRYEVDVNAQMRDQLSVDPRRDLDRGLDQRGGGIRR